MLISHSYKFIFIHVYKVAGSSIKTKLKPVSHYKHLKNNLISFIGLQPAIFCENFQPHISALELKKAIPSKIFSNYFKFAFVRNPWDWQVSLYHFAKQKKEHFQHELISKMTFDDYIDWRINEELRFQSDFVYDENENQLVNFVGKIENLDEDFNRVLKKLHLPVNSLEKVNSSRHRNYKEYYSDELAEKVEIAFKRDIINFGYSFES